MTSKQKTYLQFLGLMFFAGLVGALIRDLMQ